MSIAVRYPILKHARSASPKVRARASYIPRRDRSYRSQTIDRSAQRRVDRGERFSASAADGLQAIFTRTGASAVLLVPRDLRI